MLFGRNSNAPEYDSVLNGWTAGSDETLRSIGTNLRHDKRVSEGRAKVLDVLFDFPRASDSLMNAIKRYKERRVQTQRVPDFVVDDLNRENYVSHRTDDAAIDPDVWLVRVVDLNGLWKLLRWAKYKHVEFASFPPSGLDADVSAWWKVTFESLPQADVDELIGVMLGALAEYGSALEYQPAWVTTWKAMEPYLDYGADRWAYAVGVQPPSAERWLMLLKYRARRAGQIAAPTQLDSGWYHYFFPTPPGFPAGHPMDLSSGLTDRLIPEYIHCQISYTKEDYVAAGRRYAATTGEPLQDLPGCRARHYHLLRGVHDSRVAAWMPGPW